MAHFSPNSGFSLKVVLRYLLYLAGLLGITYLAGIWRWQPKHYACTLGGYNAYEKVQVVDYGSLNIYWRAVKARCIDDQKFYYAPRR